MKCYNCGTELIWGGDHDCEDEEEHAIVTNLSCPECGAFHLVYWGHKGEEEESKQQELFEDDDTNIQQEEHSKDMWEHYCDEEKSMMAVGKDEPCNWCGKEEHESRT
tara:strand:+ start:113 stop:433 length:321 start_codon:yes stop_codon:yes gene_type:complete